MSSSVTSVLHSGLAEYEIPGVVCSVSSDFGKPTIFSAGRLTHMEGSSSVSRETNFDLASVTKVTTTLQWLLTLVSDHQIDLEAPIGDHVENVARWLAKEPIWRLANHTSGLEAHRHFYRKVSKEKNEPLLFKAQYDSVLQAIKASPAAYLPGERQIYSDLGYILLADILGSCSKPQALYWDELYGHGNNEVHWCPSRKHALPQSEGFPYAATEQCPWRERLLRGQVHDDNCWYMGGISGHAGAFGCVEAVHKIGLEMLRCYLGHVSKLKIGSEVLKACFDERFQHPDGDRVLGWETRSANKSSTGEYFSKSSFGHLGFTGTSLWIDPEAKVVVVMLTNRVCPSRENWGIRDFRPKVHNALRRYINR